MALFDLAVDLVFVRARRGRAGTVRPNLNLRVKRASFCGPDRTVAAFPLRAADSGLLDRLPSTSPAGWGFGTLHAE